MGGMRNWEGGSLSQTGGGGDLELLTGAIYMHACQLISLSPDLTHLHSCQEQGHASQEHSNKLK